MADNLKQKAVSGVLWSAVQQFGIQIISFLSNLVLARLLSPDDYGCIGLLAIFIAISNVFITGGFVSALIQKKDAIDIDYTTAFWWNIAISVLFYCGLFFAAPHVASFYHMPSLTSILRVLGLLLIISGFSVVQNTILRKNFQFDKLARIDIVSAIISITISIALALHGWGVWSLVAQQLVARFCRCVFLWYGTTWHPTLAFSIPSFRQMFSYGSFLLMSELLNSLVDNLQGLLIGRRYSASDMGYYAQAKKLEEIPTTTISYLVGNVTFPLYSQIQNDKARLRNAVKKSMGMMNFINFPLMMLLIVIAKPLLLTLYSEKWLCSVEYFQILCLAGLVNCMQSVNYQVVAAVGRSKALFKWNVAKRLVGIVLMLTGSMFGVEGILWGMVAGFYFTYVVNAVLATKSTGYSIFRQLKDSVPLLGICAVSDFAAVAVGNLQLYNVVVMLLQVLAFGVAYLLLSHLLKREEYYSMLAICREYADKFNKYR